MAIPKKLRINQFEELEKADVESLLEFNSGISQTQPDMHLSLEELIDRFTTGRDITIKEPSEIPQGFDEGMMEQFGMPFSSIMKMSKLERLEFQQNLNKVIAKDQETLESLELERKNIKLEQAAKEAQAIKDKDKDLS